MAGRKTGRVKMTHESAYRQASLKYLPYRQLQLHRKPGKLAIMGVP
jgi:hypothetical protein